MIEQGKKLMDNNEFEKAQEVWKSILAKNPYDVEALFFQAITLRKLKNVSESLKHFDSIINLSPDNATFYSERGVTLFHAKEFKASLKDLNKAAELEPNNPYRYSSRAYVKNALNDVVGAIEDYNKCIELDPEDVIALNNLGLVEEKAGRMSSAKKLFNKADEQAKAQGIYDIEASIERLKQESGDETTENAESQEIPVESDIKESTDKDSLSKTAMEVFKSKNEFKNYLNFVKSLFKKNTKTAE